MDQWVLPAVAVTLIAYGAVSGRLRSTPVSQAMVFVALGLLAGSRVLDLVEVDVANQFVRYLAEATLTLVLFCDAVRVNLGRLRHEAALPARLPGIGLPLTIAAGPRWPSSPASDDAGGGPSPKNGQRRLPCVPPCLPGDPEVVVDADRTEDLAAGHAGERGTERGTTGPWAPDRQGMVAGRGRDRHGPWAQRLRRRRRERIGDPSLD